MCASTPPAGAVLQVEAAAEALQRRARQQQPDAEPVLLRRHDLEPDVVAHGRIEACALIRHGQRQARAVDTDRDVDAPAAVRERRVRRVVEHVANRLLDRRFDDDRHAGLGGCRT